MRPPRKGQRGRTSHKDQSSVKGQCIQLCSSSLSSWEVGLAFWVVPGPMPWELEGTGPRHGLENYRHVCLPPLAPG